MAAQISSSQLHNELASSYSNQDYSSIMNCPTVTLPTITFEASKPHTAARFFFFFFKYKPQEGITDHRSFVRLLAGDSSFSERCMCVCCVLAVIYVLDMAHFHLSGNFKGRWIRD